jgi:hypothetical protein
MNNPLQIKTIGITDSPELIDIEKPEQGLELHVGSNVFRNTNGVVKLQGKEQLVLETQPQPLALLLTMDLYDEQGTRVGHIRRNALSAHSARRFTINAKASDEATPDDPPSVTVADRITGNTVFEACLMQKRKVRIVAGHLYTHKGELVTVSPHYCRIGSGLTIFGDVVESRGSTAIIGFQIDPASIHVCLFPTIKRTTTGWHPGSLLKNTSFLTRRGTPVQ